MSSLFASQTPNSALNLLFTASTALGERVALLEDMIAAPGARGSTIAHPIIPPDAA
ncbi:MAG: hypothetical protein ACYCY2_13680 [Acidithiobacillus ferriphilus]